MLRQAQHDNKRPFCHPEEQRDEESRGNTKVSCQGGDRAEPSQAETTICQLNELLPVGPTPSGVRLSSFLRC